MRTRNPCVMAFTPTLAARAGDHLVDATRDRRDLVVHPVQAATVAYAVTADPRLPRHRGSDHFSDVLHIRISDAIDVAVAAVSDQIVVMPELGRGVTGIVELRQEIPGIRRIFVPASLTRRPPPGRARSCQNAPLAASAHPGAGQAASAGCL